MKPEPRRENHVAVYLDDCTLTKIDNTRGKVPRSVFLADIMIELFEEVNMKQEGLNNGY